MATNPTQAGTSAGQATGRAVGGAIAGAGGILGKAAARTREEAEDVWAEAKDVAGKDSGSDAALYAGLAATVALGAVELPIAAALGAGYAIFRRRR